MKGYRLYQNEMNIDFHTFVENLVAVVEAKDIYTGGHSNRVADLVHLLSFKLDIDEAEVEKIHMAAHLHDIGKIGIADGILLKPGRLTKEEFEVMKTHAEIGYRIIKKNKNMKEMSYMIRHHHERFDGQGYPKGLKGFEIPLGARVIAIVDAFDAMVTKRTYKDQMTYGQALEEIKRNRWLQFDPVIADVFIQMIKCDLNNFARIS